MMLSERQKQYVQDYRITVFDIAFLEDEVIESFQSDFRIVARFFKNRRTGREVFDEKDRTIKHGEEVAELLAVFTGDNSYREIIPEIRRKEQEGREIKVCWVVQGYIQQGITKGQLEEARQNARMFLKNGAPMELVAASIQTLTAEEVQEIYEEVCADVN